MSTSVTAFATSWLEGANVRMDGADKRIERGITATKPYYPPPPKYIDGDKINTMYTLHPICKWALFEIYIRSVLTLCMLIMCKYHGDTCKC